MFKLNIQKYMPEGMVALSTGKEVVIIGDNVEMYFKEDGTYEIVQNGKLIHKDNYTIDKISGMPIV